MRETNSRRIQILEHQRLKIGEYYHGVLFTRQDWQALLNESERHYPPYFKITHNGIKALNYVGFVSVPGLTLEILPKTSISNKNGLHKLLLDMLAYCQMIPPIHNELLLSSAQGSLHQYFISAFVEEVDQLVKEGLLKKYRTEVRNQNKFCGRVKLSEHIKHNHTHKERVYAEHQLLDEDHHLHHLLASALNVLDQTFLSQDLQFRIARLLHELPNVDNFKKQLSLNCKFQYRENRYKKAMHWAQFVLNKLKPSFSLGQQHSISCMIDMQALFEKYVAKRLQEAAINLDCRVQFQPKSKFWMKRSIRPDMVLVTPEQDKVILDTKWKILKNAQPDDADLKQIYIYNRIVGARRGILLYPEQGDIEAYASDYYHPEDTAVSCELAFVNLVDKNTGQLSTAWADELLAKILAQALV
ncbi:hypothetical protein PZB74_18240 [Porifericola rhodea]|uniref:McrC family protein n=1 Tax=Porifericola rhodea TaxID=930972 RepID=UPI002664E536|nr:hypothetical protein [Porifericola rhodea]WKN30897.1 hypothetical protein PZB74_18240 [Porifericola rhodea]